MRLYKVAYLGEPGGVDTSTGFSFHGSKREAEKEARRGSDPKPLDGDKQYRSASIEPIEVQPTKRGIIRALNLHGCHPDNG